MEDAASAAAMIEEDSLPSPPFEEEGLGGYYSSIPSLENPKHDFLMFMHDHYLSMMHRKCELEVASLVAARRRP